MFFTFEVLLLSYWMQTLIFSFDIDGKHCEGPALDSTVDRRTRNVKKNILKNHVLIAFYIVPIPPVAKLQKRSFFPAIIIKFI